MAEQTKMALDESRMLMLGAQILLGFQFQAPFQNAFCHLLPAEKVIGLVVLCLMVLVVGFSSHLAPVTASSSRGGNGEH